MLYAAFAICFSDDMSDDTSTYYPSMYDDMRDQAIAGTEEPRRRLRKLLLWVRSLLPRPSRPYLIELPSMSSPVQSMAMTLGMAVLAVHSMRLFTQIGLVSLSQNHEEITNKILAHLSAQLVAAGIINSTSSMPLPHPPQSCKYSPQLCQLSLPWLYGSVVSLTCALGTLQTITLVRKDSRDHPRETHAIRLGLGSAGVLFCIGVLKFML